MPSFDLICLANSRKLSERCIAGLRTDTGGWIRPVSKAEHGELNYSERQLGPDGEPRNFDIIRVSLAKAHAAPSQPENWLINPESWRLIERPAPARFDVLVRRAIHSGEVLFDSLSDRVPETTFHSKQARESLVLIRPSDVRWITEEFHGRRKARVSFKLGNAQYALAVTDPSVEWDIKLKDLGRHTSEELGLEESRTLFTVSLGEAFEGNCYKLVAAVLQWPQDWPKL